ncbi:HAD-IB family hydrolase [Moritella marina ATCC 15381]|uniref:HAD-IB family hydrolase n=1 Tax=Moritella marina ATCC 15381 TaxID=1202962 RepID=A0A5J6WPT0_MORMI|nr:HAD family hydrolase [Moritella marina]QFI39977.1 HAD-IB family hydrolase [Moritella marina ATCC 15381]
MSQPLYIFDLDETLIAADSAMLWHQFLVEKGIITDSNFLAEDKRLMSLYSAGKLDMPEYLNFAMAPLAYLTKQQVDCLVDECVEKYIMPMVFPQAQQLLAQLKQDKITTVLISATVSFIVKKVAIKLGIEHAMGIDMQIEDSCYTANILGVASYRDGKVIRLQSWLAEQTEVYSDSYFYTDSINDLPLCLFSQYPHVVNPCPQLALHAQVQNWPQLIWK